MLSPGLPVDLQQVFRIASPNSKPSITHKNTSLNERRSFPNTSCCTQHWFRDAERSNFPRSKVGSSPHPSLCVSPASYPRGIFFVPSCPLSTPSIKGRVAWPQFIL